ncbi:uracil-DNA glycosylase [Fodinibius sediminis]|uniref:Uracil DNA glycosylase superfamily protein n=1 Tax=Fodinibius sediminis TaxID=1214077 RepID=A0A521DWE1_9BACT|nr:uracil-DNA glycosylase [Fodinibius sediminis]SMO75955.1 Uracil DNA glycosylase superfamily protein [Fodinibius sediminis]
MNKIDSLFELLQQTPEGAFFNPWYQHDSHHDQHNDAPAIRRRQLRAYLSERISKARYLFIAEALGYQGGHFTGIAMTSERILLGHHEPVHGIPSDGAFKSVQPQRTSKPDLKAQGMSEPTATIMWKALYKLGIDPYEAVLWNALPWHPYDPCDGMLSNRTPTDQELEQGYPSLELFLSLFPGAKRIAVGRKCEQSLTEFGISYVPVRHPANGGAPKFRRQMKALIEKEE